MSSSQEFIEYIVDQIEGVEVTYRKMFGEYALYADGKVVALVCDDQLFIKPTENGKAFIGEVTEAPPYPGAKMWFLIEDTDNRRWLSELVEITADELPKPKPKKKK